MFRAFIRTLVRPAKPATPPSYDANDPRAPWNLGWTRVDVPDSRHRVRFRFALGDPPRAAPPAPPITGGGFVSAGSHMDNHAEPPKQTAKPVPLRTRLPQTPAADSPFWTRGR